jgi:hypothetical protein
LDEERWAQESEQSREKPTLKKQRSLPIGTLFSDDPSPALPPTDAPKDDLRSSSENLGSLKKVRKKPHGMEKSSWSDDEDREKPSLKHRRKEGPDDESPVETDTSIHHSGTISLQVQSADTQMQNLASESVPTTDLPPLPTLTQLDTDFLGPIIDETESVGVHDTTPQGLPIATTDLPHLDETAVGMPMTLSPQPIVAIPTPVIHRDDTVMTDQSGTTTVTDPENLEQL